MRNRAVVIGVFVLVAIGYLVALHAYDQRDIRPSIQQQREAENTMYQILVAFKNNDSQTIKNALYSKSVDKYVIKRRPNYIGPMEENRKDFRIDSISYDTIHASIHALPSVRRKLIGSMLYVSLLGWKDKEFHIPKNIVVVQYSLDGEDLISVLIPEDGKLKLDTLPACWSAKVLKYKTATEANNKDAAITNRGFKNMKHE